MPVAPCRLGLCCWLRGCFHSSPLVGEEALFVAVLSRARIHFERPPGGRVLSVKGYGARSRTGRHASGLKSGCGGAARFSFLSRPCFMWCSRFPVHTGHRFLCQRGANSMSGLCRILCRTVCRDYVGTLSGLCREYVGTMSVLRRDYVGVMSGLCRVSASLMSGPSPSQGGVICPRKGHLDPAWPTRGRNRCLWGLQGFRWPWSCLFL